MRNINILINEDHTVSFDNDYAGLNRENLQGNIVFSFKNFVDGQARAEVIIDGEDGYIMLDKVGETYTMPIKSSLLTSDFIIMQLVIDEPSNSKSVQTSYPVWKSEAFTLKVGYSINATSTIPEDYPSWIQILDELRTETEEAITKAENVNISSEQLTDGVKVITTNQDGEQTITIVPQGPQGEPGVPGAIKMLIVAELPQTGQDDTIYLVPYDILEVATLPTTGLPKTIYIITSTQKRYVYASGQWVEISSDNRYTEYVYVNNAWEELGEAGIQVDLTNYVQFTDYAGTSKPGTVIVPSWGGLTVNSAGKLSGLVRTYAQYTNEENAFVISKGTLENVITGKGLINNQVNNLANYYTKTEIDNTIGDINTAIDTINGEVI